MTELEHYLLLKNANHYGVENFQQIHSKMSMQLKMIEKTSFSKSPEELENYFFTEVLQLPKDSYQPLVQIKEDFLNRHKVVEQIMNLDEEHEMTQKDLIYSKASGYSPFINEFEFEFEFEDENCAEQFLLYISQTQLDNELESRYKEEIFKAYNKKLKNKQKVKKLLELCNRYEAIPKELTFYLSEGLKMPPGQDQ